VAALLCLERARIDVEGAPLAENLSVVSRGPRVALLGDWRALFSLLGAQATLASGSAQIDGCDAVRAVASGVVGLAPYEPQLPAAWSAGQYLTWSARLTGTTESAAKQLAKQTLERLELVALSARKLGTLMPMERRALMLAHATLGDPRVLALDRPLARLDEPAQRWLRELIHRAGTDRGLVVSVEDAFAPGVERALVEDFDEALTMQRSDLVLQGSPASALSANGRYLVTVLAGATELAARLVERGARVEITPVQGNAARLVVALPEGADPGIVLIASAEVGAPVVELVALGGAAARMRAGAEET
jgi:ABC-type Na+ transport system ATPase subunit NatA